MGEPAVCGYPVQSVLLRTFEGDDHNPPYQVVVGHHGWDGAEVGWSVICGPSTLWRDGYWRAGQCGTSRERFIELTRFPTLDEAIAAWERVREG